MIDRIRTALLGVAGFCALALAGVVQANLVMDPSIEQGAPHWVPEDYGSAIVRGVARTGNQSIKLINDGTANRATSKTHDVRQTGTGGVKPGTEYTLTVWVKGQNVKGIGAGGKPLTVLRWKSAAGAKLTQECYMWAPYGSYDWIPMRINLEAPPGAARFDVGFRSWWDVTGGVTWWDDVSLVPRDFSHRGGKLATYQAEDGTIAGGKTARHEPNYTGSGYVVPSKGGKLTWNVNGGGGGTRVLSMRYAHEGGPGEVELYVNGARKDKVKFAATGRVSSWATHDWTVPLKAGANTVALKFTKVSGKGPYVDRLDVYARAGSSGGGGGGNEPPPPTPTAAAPAFSPAAGTYADSVTVRLSTGTQGGVIHYTLDGSVPSSSSPVYTAPVVLTATTTVKAVTLADGYRPSPVVSRTYTIKAGGSAGQSTPYGGIPQAIPGRIHAVHFDEGGQRVAYFDSTPGNKGGWFRPNESVDVWRTGDPGSGYMVGTISKGEWLEYTVDVARAGTYDLLVRAATPYTGRRLHIELDGRNVTGPIELIPTGAWNSFATTVVSGVSLPAGRHLLRVMADSKDMNLNWFEFAVSASGGGSDGGPGGGAANPGLPVLPARIEAEDFDEGGYKDTTPGNDGGWYRPEEDVDIWRTADTGGRFLVGNVARGEWLSYSVWVDTAGSYDLALRVATPKSGRGLHVEVDGVDVTGPVRLPNTGGWQVWETVTVPGIDLSAGAHVITIVPETSGMNLNWFEFN